MQSAHPIFSLPFLCCLGLDQPVLHLEAFSPSKNIILFLPNPATEWSMANSCPTFCFLTPSWFHLSHISHLRFFFSSITELCCQMSLRCALSAGSNPISNTMVLAARRAGRMVSLHRPVWFECCRASVLVSLEHFVNSPKWNDKQRCR